MNRQHLGLGTPVPDYSIYAGPTFGPFLWVKFRTIASILRGVPVLGFASIQFSMRKSLVILFALALMCQASPKPVPPKVAANSNSAAKSRSTPNLDTALVRKLYSNGDFEHAINILETGSKEKRVYEHKDSVFILKHLGVMYAAKYETREKGKYYLHKLLTVEPTAQIFDMYASDMIYTIFKNIQAEYAESNGHNSASTPQTAGIPKTSSPSKGRKTLYWVGASTVAAAFGVTAYFLLATEPSKGDPHQLK